MIFYFSSNMALEMTFNKNYCINLTQSYSFQFTFRATYHYQSARNDVSRAFFKIVSLFEYLITIWDIVVIYF